MKRFAGIINIAIASISLISALVTAEILLRITGIGYGNAPMDSSDKIHHIHPKNYSFISYDVHHEYGGHRVAFDELGYSVDPSPTSSKAQIPNGERRQGNEPIRIAFMGDSFVEGITVPYESSFIGLLQKKASSNISMKNFGVSSYCPVLYRIQWDEDVRAYNPTHVILMLYFNDIEDDLKHYANATHHKEEIATAVAGPSRTRLVATLRNLYLARLLRKFQLQLEWYIKNPRFLLSNKIDAASIESAPDIPEITTRTLLSLKEEIQAAGAILIITAVPSKARLQQSQPRNGDEFADKVQKWAIKNDVPYIDLKKPFQREAKWNKLFFDIDIHFNEKGHSLVAKTMKKAYPDLFGR